MTTGQASPYGMAPGRRKSLDQTHIEYLMMSSSSVAELVERLADDRTLAQRPVTIKVEGGMGTLVDLSALDARSLDAATHSVVLEAAECGSGTQAGPKLVGVVGHVDVSDAYDLAVAYAVALAAGAAGDGAHDAMRMALETMLGTDDGLPAGFDARAACECACAVAQATRRTRPADPTDAAICGFHADVRSELATWAAGEDAQRGRGLHLRGHRQARRRTTGPSQELRDLAEGTLPDLAWPRPLTHALGALDALWAASCVRYGLEGA